MLKAINTQYNGYRFRSRLEARWAVFFDEVGIRYEYEPEGFALASGPYLPDFYLPELKTYVEIKPSNAFEFSFDKDEQMMSFGGEGCFKYADAANYFLDAGYMYLFLCGDPFDILLKGHGGHGNGFIIERLKCLIRMELEDGDEINWEKTECNPEKCASCDHCEIASMIPFIGFSSSSSYFIVPDQGEALLPKHFEHFIPVTKDCRERDTLADNLRRNIEAAKKARQARFEHGEKG